MSADTAFSDAGTPPSAGIAIRERLGQRLDPTLSFRDHRGQPVKLAQYFDGHTPVLLTLNYYRCRTVCDLQLARLAPRLRELERAGTAYRALSVSIDPRDGVEQAHAKQAQYAKVAGSRADWSFLVGDPGSASALAAGLGSTFRYDPRSDQYAHAPALFVATPDGHVARYLYGVDYPSRDVRFALIEAAEGRSGSSLDKFLLTCFQFDRGTGRYGPYVLGLVRVGGVLTLIALGLMVFALRRGEQRRARQP